MQDWLMTRGVELPEGALKRELFRLIQLSSAEPKHVIDKMAKATGQVHCSLWRF